MANTYHGTYKDIVSRIRWFEQCGRPYRQIMVAADDPTTVVKVLGAARPACVLFEYTHYPRLVRHFKRCHPAAKVLVRAINLEPLQHFDNHGWWPQRGPLWMLYGMARLLAGDLACKRHADVIWSINDWENRVYWDRLPGRARIEWLPYYCPRHLQPSGVVSPEDRRRIACLPTSQKNRKSWDLVTRFIRFAESATALPGNPYEFLVTGNLAEWGLLPSPSVVFTGMISDLREFLPTVKAVAMLSPLGYGFKTTIADAIANGCYVLAHPSLARRCPQLLQSAIIPFDTSRPRDLAALMDRLQAQFPLSSVNAELERAAEYVLSRDFGMAGTATLSPSDPA